MPKKELNFEQSLQLLNVILDSLDDPDIGIDESLKLYEEGIKLIRACRKKIDNAKQKIKYIDEAEDSENE
ncbi:MAG: exodeoxyribonuclease VII small subunit [Ruminococcaceae bacterium]|nr:exodeoxyribonuclease VII small subunit [Oscillospiraceae bacterium]MBO4971809.1 exodeoxyribonuclease VII small subunit [Clostridia bacterium]MBQ1258698.1 exodeoxyribonuclease VII small subunit [Clostridia bacterium]